MPATLALPLRSAVDSGSCRIVYSTCSTAECTTAHLQCQWQFVADGAVRACHDGLHPGLRRCRMGRYKGVGSIKSGPLHSVIGPVENLAVVTPGLRAGPAGQPTLSSLSIERQWTISGLKCMLSHARSRQGQGGAPVQLQRCLSHLCSPENTPAPAGQPTHRMAPTIKALNVASASAAKKPPVAPKKASHTVSAAQTARWRLLSTHAPDQASPSLPCPKPVPQIIDSIKEATGASEDDISAM